MDLYILYIEYLSMVFTTNTGSLPWPWTVSAGRTMDYNYRSMGRTPEALKWFSSLHAHFKRRSHSGGDSAATGYIISLFPHVRISPSLISLTVSVDVKHHVYLLALEAKSGQLALTSLLWAQ